MEVVVIKEAILKVHARMINHADEPSTASCTVPLSFTLLVAGVPDVGVVVVVVVFDAAAAAFASSDFFFAANCHAGIAALPALLPNKRDWYGFEFVVVVDEEEVLAGAVYGEEFPLFSAAGGEEEEEEGTSSDCCTGVPFPSTWPFCDGGCCCEDE